MLSDEEKKAIDLLKNIDKQKCMMFECPVVKNNIERQLKIIELNRTIRKQSKEIEELKNGQIDFWISDKEIEDRIKNKFTSKDKLKEMLNGYKKALKDVEEAIGVLKSNLLIVEYEKEIQKELTFREEDRISKISIINLLEDLLKEE